MSSVYSLDVTNEGGKRQLTFSGDLIINHIDKMAAEVKEAIQSPSDAVVVVSDPSNIDMTFIQLLLAIRRQTTEGGKAFEVKSTIKDDLKELIQKSGFDKALGL